jgi:hypothetical protein
MALFGKRYRLNLSSSEPAGMYCIERLKRGVQRGDLVIMSVPDQFKQYQARRNTEMSNLKIWEISLAALLSFCSTGCASNPDGSSSYQRTGIGVSAGGALGAATGALFGGNRGTNAAIGGGAGLLVGGVVGNYMDRQAAALKKNMPEAKWSARGKRCISPCRQASFSM